MTTMKMTKNRRGAAAAAEEGDDEVEDYWEVEED